MNYLNIELDGIDENGINQKYKLSDFKGKNIILYFYPQDGTPVCTQEAQEFRDAMEDLSKYAVIIGVSSNNSEEHIEFKNENNLNFILLCDDKNELKKAFEDHSEYITNLNRATFILDNNGHIVKHWEKVDVDEHIKEIKDYFSQNNQ